jgi:hypothetical protein
MKSFYKVILCSFATAVMFLETGHAANLASDNAADAVYSGGGNYNGLNGGTGFGAWINTPANSSVAGSFVFTSTANAGGSLSIDTSGNAWGLYANSGNVSDAVRPFTGGALTIGQTVTINLDQGYEDTGATVGIGLQNSSFDNLMEVYYIGGDSVNSWKKNDAAGQSDLSPNVPFSGDGFHLEITLATATTYTGVLTSNDGGSATFSGTLISPLGGQDITQVRLFNANSGMGDNANFYGNSLAIVPEPSTVVLVGLGMLGVLALRRRKGKRHAMSHVEQ